jgi:hypothetical protein
LRPRPARLPGANGRPGRIWPALLDALVMRPSGRRCRHC